jgi:hypothetical protein
MTAYSSSPSVATSYGVPLAIGMAAGLAIAGCVIFAFFLLWPQKPAPSGSIQRYVGANLVTMPVDYLQRNQTPVQANRLDLAISWPDFGPAKRLVLSADGRIEPATGETTLLVTLRGTDATIAPAERVIDVYSRFLEGDIWSNPGGLVMRRFRTGTPYEGEDLFYSMPDGRDFAARCPSSLRNGALGNERCLWISRQDGFDIETSFDAALLTQWAEMREKMARAVSGLAGRH